MPATGVSPQALLDELQAAEAAGAEALARWCASCTDAGLRGGLRVIQARDAAHARLAQRRLAALGGVPHGTVSRELDQLCGVLAAPEVSSRSKLTILLARFPTPRAESPAPAARDPGDDETRALIATIRDDDRASVRWLHEIGERPPDESSVPLVTSEAVLGFLDAYRAAETAGGDVVGAWRAVCQLPGLRGGLDTIAEREHTHAALLAARLQELGGVARARMQEDVLEPARDRFGSSDRSDEEKLASVIARVPDEESVTRPVLEVAQTIEADAETREMLCLIAAGEAATFAWLRSYWKAITDYPRNVSLRVLDGGR
jgi:hypothetical protein